jgi:hypothetical protein
MELISKINYEISRMPNIKRIYPRQLPCQYCKLYPFVFIYVYAKMGINIFFRNTYIALWHLYNYVMCMCLVTLLDFKLMKISCSFFRTCIQQNSNNENRNKCITIYIFITDRCKHTVVCIKSKKKRK